MEEIILYSDGGARGNPGDAGIGLVFTNADGKILGTVKRYIGKATNNQAEYTALIKGLEKAMDYGAERVKAVLDSELVVRQLKGEYKVRNPTLLNLYIQVMALEKGFKQVKYSHVSRENDKIKIADRLVNEAIDEKVKGS